MSNILTPNQTLDNNQKLFSSRHCQYTKNTDQFSSHVFHSFEGMKITNEVLSAQLNWTIDLSTILVEALVRHPGKTKVDQENNQTLRGSRTVLQKLVEIQDRLDNLRIPTGFPSSSKEKLDGLDSKVDVLLSRKYKDKLNNIHNSILESDSHKNIASILKDLSSLKDLPNKTDIRQISRLIKENKPKDIEIFSKNILERLNKEVDLLNAGIRTVEEKQRLIDNSMQDLERLVQTIKDLVIEVKDLAEVAAR